ncbi:cell division cycle- protein, partial [Ascosphaera aggregata]
MEHSSPLAAMQPPSVLFGHCFRPGKTATGSSGGGGVGGAGGSAGGGGGGASNPSLRCPISFGPNGFNFKDSFFKGSSPTVSLAADLSQNFHIDKSPQLTTPRRSLFSSNYRGEAREQATPSLPPSSPTFEHMDFMDLSPLPHKVPWTQCSEGSESQSSSRLSRHIYVPSPLQDSPLDTNTSNSSDTSRRKKALVLRPSLMKKTQSFLSRPTPLRQIPDLDVSPASSNLQTPASPSLSEMFEDGSPVRDSRTLATPGSPIKFTSGGIPTHRDGSPVPRRRSPNPFARPRKQTRRSMSMFEKTEEVLTSSALVRAQQVEEEMGYFSTNKSLPSNGDDLDMDAQPSLRLPHFMPEDMDDQLPRIDQQTMVDVLNGKYNDHYRNIRIVDCRFPFEYEGGHINGAVNHSAESLASELFCNGPEENTALILHCEFSKYRAPEMAQCIRSRDRAFNIHVYPKLSYPEMYILEGGYSAFFSEYKNHCFPQSYIKMGDKAHEFACERGLGKIKQRSKLARASTFTFGQKERLSIPSLNFPKSRIDESPTTKKCRGTKALNAVHEEQESPFQGR